jgi:hypothetical protein
MKAWRQATIAAEKRMEKAKARKEKGDMAKIIRAVRLKRRGAISRARKAPEIKGLGDLDDNMILEKIDYNEKSTEEAEDIGGGVCVRTRGGATG